MTIMIMMTAQHCFHSPPSLQVQGNDTIPPYPPPSLSRQPMPKFSDQWVVDRTLFEFVSGGSCACCGRALFVPGGLEGMIQAMSDLETDAAQAEIKANQTSPWPPAMREQVWSDRIRLRHKMKQELKYYQTFWSHHGTDFGEWCQAHAQLLKKVFQLPRAEVVTKLNHHYGIHSAFGIVLRAVTEQVARFPETLYPIDARGQAEADLERILTYDRRGGFTIPILDKEGTLQLDVLEIWLRRVESLGGPKLLERAPRKEDDGETDDADPDDSSSAKPSFRSDRRVVRLLIARYWADALIDKYHASKQQVLQQEETADDATNILKQDKATTESTE